MNEQAKANEWEFWDFDVSASSYYLNPSPNQEPKNTQSKDGSCRCNRDGSSVDCKRNHILPSHVEAAETPMPDEDEVDKAWREFDSYESIMGKANQVEVPEAKKTTGKIPSRKQPAPTKTKSLNPSRDKSQSPPRGLTNVKSNTKGARAA